MVTERADMPEQGDTPAVETQGITDLTPQGQDSPNFGVVDDAPVEQTATPVADDSGTQVPVEGQASPVPTEQPVNQEQAKTEPSEQIPPQDFTQLKDEVRKQQEQLQYYNQLEQRATIQNEAQQYQQQLQQQGYLPEQAQQMAQQRAARATESLQMEQQAENYRMFREGQRNAAVHYAKEYQLGIDDLAALEKFSTPQEMEKEAADIAKYRGLAAENARLKQQQVPSQQLDNNQPSPSATGNEDQLLDRYIGGDRSPEAVSAAQRLLNLS